MADRHVEMSYISQPPRYDSSRYQPNGEPPGYLDTSQREFLHDTERGYVPPERGYPLDDRRGDGYAPESHGYANDRNFRPMDQQGYLQEYPEHERGYGISRGAADDMYPADVSYDSQPAVMMTGIPRDGYSRAVTDPASLHVRDTADRPYGTSERPYGAEPMSTHIRGANDQHVYADRGYADNTQRYYVSNGSHTYSQLLISLCFSLQHSASSLPVRAPGL